jgi:acyl-coenzyme A thioesterase PaaI-like protein
VVAGLSHLFRSKDGLLVPTDLVRGPWDHGLQHGGAVCGALAWVAHRAIEADDPGCAPDAPTKGRGGSFQLCRLTTEILRPVPVAPLGHRASITHRGRRSRVVTAELLNGDRAVARASAQWAVVNRAASAAPGGSDPAVPRRPPEIHDPGAADVGYPRPGFNCDVFELRCLVGSTEDEGPGVVWARMVRGVVESSPDHPVHALAALSDLANAVGWERSPNDAPMINADVTLQLVRYPVGPWICLEARATASATGIGIMETTLWDGDGRFGRVLSTIVESPVALAIDL